MKTTKEHEFRFFLSAESVDLEKGIIRGVTIGKANVDAVGHKIMFDGNNDRTEDPAQAKRKLQMATDEKTLATLMDAFSEIGDRAKCREDHDDSIGSRAGFIDNPRLIGDRTVGDLHLFNSYRNRAVVLETAEKTPGEIGLSIDFTPTFEIRGEKAFMRVTKLEAVDIVDAGAITPGGLFCRKGVDNENMLSTGKPDPQSTMATENQKEPSVADCMAAISSLAEAFKKFATPPAEASDDQKKMAAALDQLNVKLAALETGFTTLKADTAVTDAELKKEQAALGLKLGAGKGAGEAGGGGGDAAAEAERTRLKAEADAAKPKTFLQLCAEKKAEGKLSATESTRFIIRTKPAEYALHLKSKGIAA